jgi:hypothetical protein
MGGNGKGNQSRDLAALRRRANDERLLAAADAAGEIIVKSRNPGLTMARFLIALADTVQTYGAPAVTIGEGKATDGELFL